MNFYPMNEQLLKYLEEARLAYLDMLEKEWLEVSLIKNINQKINSQIKMSFSSILSSPI